MKKIEEILGNDAVHNLQQGNITSTADFILADLKELEDYTNLSRDILKGAQITISEQTLCGKIQKASSLILKTHPVSSGCLSIDTICSGGFPSNGICEIVAPSGTGKSQLCIQLALEVQLVKDNRGVRKESVYISTEGPFPSKRLRQLSEIYHQKHKDLDNFSFEDHVYLKHVTEYVDLEKCLEKELPMLLRNKNIGLIIIDSITGVFRGDEEDTNYIARSTNILKIATTLNRIQDEFGCAIIATNQVADNKETGTWDPCLGLAWANQVTYRFQLTRRNNDSPIRDFKIEFAPDLAKNTCQFLISKEGVTDC